MGAKRKIVEEVNIPSSNQQTQTNVRERETTDLEWVNEFVAKKIQSYILSGLKTAKVHILLFGSPRTNNTLLQKSHVKEGYQGIDEIFLPNTPTIATLELLRCLRAAKNEEEPYIADPLDALIAAITTLRDKEVSNITEGYRKTIYLITDGKSAMNKSDKELIQKGLTDDNIILKVVGIDFDDLEVGYKEEDKPAVKAKNEAWWHSFLESLPTSGLATAVHAIAQASLPSIHLQTSAPSATNLLFGDPDRKDDDPTVLAIPIKIYKATAVARPLSQKRLSRIAQESAAARNQSLQLSQQASQLRPSSTPDFPRRQSNAYNKQDNGGETGLTYGVQMQKKYFIKDDLEMVEGGIEGAEPLPEGAENTFDKAYKLGATLVAVNEDLQRQMDTKNGLEIIQFTNRKLYRRHLHLGETWFVFGSNDNYKAQIQMSSMIQAMSRQDKYAIVRYIRTNGAEPKLGILAPILKDEVDAIPYECMCFVEVPFREDLKRFTFPPLDRVINRDGKELKEHASLPSKEMQSCMNDLVDSMDLMDAVEDEDGQDAPWFKCVESFNPTIHTTKEAVSWRVFHPEDKSLPLPHPEVVKFLQAPEKVTKRSEALGKRCRELFDLNAYYPMDKKREGKRQAEERARERGDEDEDGEKKEINLEGVMDEELAAEASRTLQDDSSGTEDEEEIQVSLKPPPPPPPSNNNGKERQTTSIADIATDAISDFERKLADRDHKIENVIDSMGDSIASKVTSSFGSNGYTEAKTMLQAMRRGAIEYEEAERFNDFLRSFKAKMLDESAPRSRVDFWDSRIRGRSELGLITDQESLADAPVGVSKKHADDFINL